MARYFAAIKLHFVLFQRLGELNLRIQRLDISLNILESKVGVCVVVWNQVRVRGSVRLGCE